MNSIIFTRGKECAEQRLLHNIYRLRYEAFYERLAWNIEVKDGMEKDRFDELDPHHVAVTNANGEVNGYWRALPTDGGEYMLKKIFPELLQGEDAPVDRHVWEISRFAVRKGSSLETRGSVAAVTKDMVESFYLLARRERIKSYVTVTTVACERLLRRLGVDFRRMGDGKSLQIGKERSVALWINACGN